MATRVRRQQQHHRSRQRDDAPQTEASAKGATGGDLKNDLDDLLDEIDEVLEVNAEEFVAAYVQKGGE